jgi:hypothetical protein
MAALQLHDGIRVIEPLGYIAFLGLMARARLVLTDNGGIQEETTVLHVPCLTLRHNTERPITCQQGTNFIAGTDPNDILHTTLRALNAPPPNNPVAREVGWPCRRPDRGRLAGMAFPQSSRGSGSNRRTFSLSLFARDFWRLSLRSDCSVESESSAQLAQWSDNASDFWQLQLGAFVVLSQILTQIGISPRLLSGAIVHLSVGPLPRLGPLFPPNPQQSTALHQNRSLFQHASGATFRKRF